MSSLGWGFSMLACAFFSPTARHPLGVFVPITSLFFMRLPFANALEALFSTDLDPGRIFSETWPWVLFLKVGSPVHLRQHHDVCQLCPEIPRSRPDRLDHSL